MATWPTCSMNRRIALWSLILCLLLLAVGTCTPLFKGLLVHLPRNSDLAFHFLAHTVLVLCLAVLTRLPLITVFVSSVAFAVFIEAVQQILVVGRSAQVTDMFAAALGSCATFLFSEERVGGRRCLRPGVAKLVGYADDVPDAESGSAAAEVARETDIV